MANEKRVRADFVFGTTDTALAGASVTTLLSDHFDRADATAVGSPQVGPDPVYSSGSTATTPNWGISGNTAKPTVSNSSDQIVLWNLGTAEYVMTVTLTQVATGASGHPAISSFVVRADTTGAHYLVQANGTGNWELYYRTGATSYTLIQQSTTAVAAGQVLETTVTSSGVSVKVNGVSTLSDTNTRLNTLTYVGLRSYDGDVKWDSLKVTTTTIPADGKIVDLDAAALTVADNATLTSWGGFACSGNVVYRAAGSAVSGPAVELVDSGANITLGTVFDGLTAGEIFVAVRNKDTTNRQLWDIGTNTDQSHYPFSGIVYDDFGSTTRRSFTPSQVLTDWHIYNVSSQTNEWIARHGTASPLETKASVTTNTVGFKATGVKIGGTAGANGQEYAGFITRLVAYNRVLTAAERDEVVKALAKTVNTTLIDTATISSPALARLPVVNSTSHAPLILTDAAAGHYEILHVVDHAEHATTATAYRAREGSGKREWPIGTTWQHGPTVQDHWDVASAVVAADESTTATAFTDLATVGPQVTVRIGASGRALVTVGALMLNDTAAHACRMSFAVSGATTVAADTTKAVMATSPDANSQYRMSRTSVVTGLAAGSNTFTAKYEGSGGTARFIDRQIIVIPL